MDFLNFLLFIWLVMIIWFLPIAGVLASKNVLPAEKAAWILLIVFVSWFSWIFFKLLAPIKSDHTTKTQNKSQRGTA